MNQAGWQYIAPAEKAMVLHNRRRAYKELDRTVMKTYGFSREMTEVDVVAALMARRLFSTRTNFDRLKMGIS